MSIATVLVSGQLYNPDGTPATNVDVRFILSGLGVVGLSLLVPRFAVGATDAAGAFALQIVPSPPGTFYTVRAGAAGALLLSVKAVVPANDCQISQIMQALPYPPIDASQQALLDLQAAQAEIEADRLSAAASASSASQSAQQTGEDVIQTGDDRVATGEDRIATGQDLEQTGQDRLATGRDRIATGEDRVQTGEDRIATGQDIVQTGEDRLATGEDRFATGQHLIAAGEDRAQTGQDRIATGEDRIATGQDRVATGEDRLATGQDRAQTAADKAAASTSAGQSAGSAAQALAIYGTTAAMQAKLDTAAAQASAAQAAAASAASVLQQDLSAVSAALHRSPNAVTAMCIYDLSKDTDSGAWVERMGHTSWMNEALNGAWRGALASEAAARAISGAATGDYYQLTTDGKFYKLKATSGVTEVFRGNKAKFPRLAAIVAEVSSVVVYDLTQPGQPMWMRFRVAGTSTKSAIFSGTVGSVAAVNGVLCVGASNISTGTLTIINFAKDMTVTNNGTRRGLNVQPVLLRNSLDAISITEDYFPATIASRDINVVAMSVLPDAPCDLVTSLQVPTIAVATSGGVSVIKHDGTVTNLAPATGGNIYFDRKGSAVNIGENTRNYRKFLAPGYTTALTYIGGPLSFDSAAAAIAGNSVHKVGKDISALLRSSANVFGFLRENDQTPAKSLYAEVAASYGTGFMLGEIRRAYLCNTEVESVSAPELMVNGAFLSDASGWGSDGAVTWVSPGVASCASGGASNIMLTSAFSTVAGKTYLVAVDVSATNGSAGIYLSNATTAQVWPLAAGTGARRISRVFTAIAANATFQLAGASANAAATVNAVSVMEVIADRSYKAAGANIYGALVKSQVAPAAQLVAWSGFSALNYIQEPAYSADLDFGTGEWSVGASVSYTTAVASIIAERSAATGPYLKLGTDAAGKLVATAYDGTTTRSITSPAAYNTGAYLHPAAHYSAGRLSIKVNGVEVAFVAGAPLLTLNNPAAILTIGQSRALDAPFPGSITLLKIGATVPTAEQSVLMYEQEKQMFQPGAQITLPAATAVTDLSYDESQDKWVVVQAGYESSFTGLIRTSAAAPSAGNFSKVDAKGGVKLLARTTASPGVDVTIPAYGLREELVRRCEAAARANRPEMDVDVDFVAAQTDWSAPVGFVITGVSLANAKKREGATKDYIKLFDGFRETARMAVAPGAGVWGQFTIRKE